MNRFEEFELEGLTLQQLRYFNAVAEGETFADAAAAIGISQSALSQGIARLEQVAGVRLLERDGRRRRVTEAGERVAEYARRILGESETLAADLAARRDGVAGRLRIGMIDAAVLYLFRDALHSFRKRHPAVELSIAVAGSSELEQRLADFRHDAVVVVGPSHRGTSQHIYTESMHLYGSEELSESATFALYPQGSRTRDAIDAGLDRIAPRRSVIGESGNPSVLRELCALTGAFTVLPEQVAATGGSLDVVARDVAEREIHVVVRPDAIRQPLVREFVEELETAVPS